MAVVINTNVDSLKIQNLLSSSTSKMSEAMQRMSSGLKILSAKDDAAGSVISARMEVQLNGNKIAQNNVQNGNAMLSSAEGNIDVVLDNVSRIRDLTLQAKNGTYSVEEIQAMQDEVEQRMAEIDRISNSAKYSQLNLFSDKTLQENGVTFQVGANATEFDTIHADKGIFESVEFADVTKRTDEVNDEEEIDWTSGIKKQALPATSTGCSFVEITRNEYVKLQNEIEADATHSYKDKIQHIKFLDEDTPTEDAHTVTKEMYLIEMKDEDIEKEGLTKAELPAFNATPADGDYASYVAVTKEVTKALELTILDEKGFTDAINDLDAAIDNLTARKSQIGSSQNRLESALETLSIQNTNLSSANSIIVDTDIAAEASSFTQQQILQQVSTSLLAQANQAPSVALSLV